MWPRWIQSLLGLWLIATPFLFSEVNGALPSLLIQATAGLFILTFTLFSFVRDTDQPDWPNLGMALILAAVAFFLQDTLPDSSPQNLMGTGLTLAMFSILPSNVVRPPAAWQKFYRSSADSEEG